MGFIRKQWQAGDYIYPEDLNNIEGGIEDLQNAKADRHDVAYVVEEIDAHKKDLDTLHDDLTVMQEAIQATDQQIGTKAEINDVVTVAAALEETKLDLENLRDKTETKAERIDLETVALDLESAWKDIKDLQHDAEYVDEKIAAVAAGADLTANDLRLLDQRVDGKADINDLAQVTTAIDLKADSATTEPDIKIRGRQVDLASLCVETDMISTRLFSAQNEISAVRAEMADFNAGIAGRVAKPVQSPNGTNGQVLSTHGDGTTEWINPIEPSDEQIGEAVSDWLGEHPEATTTVADGSITEDKLDSALKEQINNATSANETESAIGALSQDISRIYHDDLTIYRKLSDWNDWKAQLQAYAALFGGNGFGYLFFTDPHCLSMTDESGGQSTRTPYTMMQMLHRIRNVYEHSPAQYVLCGGDWITWFRSQAEHKAAISQLINLGRTEICYDFYTALGNHEFDYANTGGCVITSMELARMLYNRQTPYFVIDSGNCKCYVLDSGELGMTMNAYRWTQIDWFARSLRENTCQHLFGLMHYTRYGSTEAPFAGYVTEIADAFNQRTTITLNGSTYNFTNATGTFQYLLEGHHHQDLNRTLNHIPVITTTACFADGGSFDLCYADFDFDQLRTVRIGQGRSREIPIIPVNGYQASPA